MSAKKKSTHKRLRKQQRKKQKREQEERIKEQKLSSKIPLNSISDMKDDELTRLLNPRRKL